MWTNENYDKLNWQRHTSFTQTVDTGPSADHTYGKIIWFIYKTDADCGLSLHASNTGLKLELKFPFSFLELFYNQRRVVG